MTYVFKNRGSIKKIQFHVEMTSSERLELKMPCVPHNTSKVTVPARYCNNATVSYFEMYRAAAAAPASQSQLSLSTRHDVCQ